MRDVAGLRAPLLEGARLGGTLLDSDGVGLAPRGLFAAAADGRLSRGNNVAIGLRVDALEEGRGAVCALTGGRMGLVSLARFDDAGGQTWSPS